MSVNFNNFDSEYYVGLYTDLQAAVAGLRPTQRHAFLVKHYMQHGRFEKRSYRLKSSSSSSKPCHLSGLDSQNVEQKYRRFYPTGTKTKNYEKVIDFDCNGMPTDKSRHKGKDKHKDKDTSNSDNDSDGDSDAESDKEKECVKERHRGRRKHRASAKDSDSSKGESSDRDSSQEREASVERYLEKSRERDRIKALEKERIKALVKHKSSKKASPKPTNETFSIEWR